MNEQSLKDLSEGNALVREAHEILSTLAGTLYDAGLQKPAYRATIVAHKLSRAAALIDKGTGGALAAHVGAGEQATRNMVLAALAVATRQEVLRSAVDESGEGLA